MPAGPSVARPMSLGSDGHCWWKHHDAGGENLKTGRVERYHSFPVGGLVDACIKWEWRWRWRDMREKGEKTKEMETEEEHKILSRPVADPDLLQGKKKGRTGTDIKDRQTGI